jgi:hypothetical protein
MQMFENLELCEYFNKMIKRLDVTAPNTRAFINSKQIFKICQVFSNIEKLRCNIDRPDNLQLILNQLSKLIHMKVFSYKTPHYNAGNFWLQDHQSELDLYSFTIKCESDYFQHDDEYYSSDDPFDNDIVSDW